MLLVHETLSFSMCGAYLALLYSMCGAKYEAVLLVKANLLKIYNAHHMEEKKAMLTLLCIWNKDSFRDQKKSPKLPKIDIPAKYSLNLVSTTDLSFDNNNMLRED